MTPAASHSPQARPGARFPARLETLALFHAGLMVLLSSWGFGGNAPAVQTALTVLGLPALLLTLHELRRRRQEGATSRRTLLWLVPLLAFNGLTLAALLQPSLRSVTIEGAVQYVRLGVGLGWPSSARPDLALRELLLFDALVLPAFNLAWVVRTRSGLRALLLFCTLNVFVLGVLGTLQTLSGAGGLYFGTVPSPNPTFFATFIYHNHWGAFTLLCLGAAAGLLFHLHRRTGRHRLLHSPVPALSLVILAVAATVPLSSSRSSTALVFLLLGIAFLDALRRLGRGGPAAGPGRVRAGLLVATAVAGIAAVFWLAEPVLRVRAALTRSQLEQMREAGTIGARAQLYGDTWRMAADRLAYGWGLGSYGTVFAFYNSLESADRLPQHYEDAHSDWLESVAETGLLGTACRGLMLLVPLLAVRRWWRQGGPLPVYGLLGCGLVLAYAWVEFPFGNAAVILTFWLVFYASLRLIQLEAHARGA
jgi:O-antigen ligase